MRIAVLMHLAPRKLGAFERWILALAHGARRRGHHLDVYGQGPVHAEVARGLSDAKAGSFLLTDLGRSPFATLRRLASYDVLHLNLMAPRGPLSRLAYAAWPAQVIFVDHSSGHFPPRKNPVARAMDRLTFARAARVLGVSRFVTERDRALFGLSEDKARLVYNGVEVPSSIAPRPDGPLQLLTGGHLIPEKGVQHLLGALCRLRDLPVQLQIVGDGPQEPLLKEQVRKLHLVGRVEFLGLRDDVTALMQAAHVFVHPATWAEAFGFTVAEAMASGCAVVASNVGAMPELLEHGRTGLLVEPGNEAALADALARLAQDPARRERLGRAAFREARRHFRLADCVRAHLDECEEAASLRSSLVSPLPPLPPLS
jgi:L-malate glycosyltransferase